MPHRRFFELEVLSESFYFVTWMANQNFAQLSNGSIKPWYHS
jgi:hypothetical protein